MTPAPASLDSLKPFATAEQIGYLEGLLMMQVQAAKRCNPTTFLFAASELRRWAFAVSGSSFGDQHQIGSLLARPRFVAKDRTS